MLLLLSSSFWWAAILAICRRQEEWCFVLCKEHWHFQVSRDMTLEICQASGWFLVPESGSIQLHNYSEITVFTKFLCESISAPFEPEDDLPLLW
ncbi:uncharacterized protein LOC116248637 isoform X3 [Nymphaea colorata]|uniref:uncharacterized protein LOC116248637 isoform X3 n=1 Tax=Nymphaea colorata TaxID=210225 RepID=UPI00214EB05A|nr:uncharacterized protein LOC116248637 isoform X3 [Nymphaea colorata]